MAHVLQAYLLLCSRDPRSACARRARCWRAPPRCRPTSASALHLAAIDAVLDDDYERAKARLGELLRQQPRDVLALQVAHSLDYVTGDAARHARPRRGGAAGVVGATCPATTRCWRCTPSASRRAASTSAPRRPRAPRWRSNPLDARAHHVMAHVFEMTERADAGVRWMHDARRALGRRQRRGDALLVAPGAVPPRAGPARPRAGVVRPHVRAGRSTRGRRPDRRLGAALARRAARRRRRARAGPSWPPPGRRTSTTLLQLQRPARDARIRRRARLGARAAPRARARRRASRGRRATARRRASSACRRAAR